MIELASEQTIVIKPTRIAPKGDPLESSIVKPNKTNNKLINSTTNRGIKFIAKLFPNGLLVTIINNWGQPGLAVPQLFIVLNNKPCPSITRDRALTSEWHLLHFRLSTGT